MRWFKNFIRWSVTNKNVMASTDISSIPGSIFIGNMSMFTDTSTLSRGTRTVATHEHMDDDDDYESRW